jgi:shikimate kinase
MNVSLIGMSGAGKSYVGRQLADALDLTFVDVDAVLEKHAQKPLSEIIDELGEAAFIRVEGAAVEKACDGDNQLI